MAATTPSTRIQRTEGAAGHTIGEVQFMKLSQLLIQLQLFCLLIITLLALWQRHRLQKAIDELSTLDDAPLPEPAPHVSIILPVRNEEAHLEACLTSLLAQDYPDFDVTVVDDASSDATPAILAAWARRDARVRVLRVAELPEGWAGKAHALHTGVLHSSGEWLLFTDADTRHAPQTLRRAMAHALAHGLDLLTLFTDTQLRGRAARLLTACGAALLTLLATPAEMRDPQQRTRVLAIGQYILVRRAPYLASGGYSHPDLRATFSDDIALAWQLKRQGCREDIVAERGLVYNEQWTTWQSAWEGMRKSNYGLVAGNPLLGIVLGLALLVYGLLPPAALLGTLKRSPRRRRAPTALLALSALALQIDGKRRFERAYGLPAGWSLTAPLGWATFGLLMLDTTRLAFSGQGASWKGRRAPQQARNVNPLAIMGSTLKHLEGSNACSAAAEQLLRKTHGHHTHLRDVVIQRLSGAHHARSGLAGSAPQQEHQGDATTE
jgi:chlorobactene glucosyltransferase